MVNRKVLIRLSTTMPKYVPHNQCLKLLKWSKLGCKAFLHLLCSPDFSLTATFSSILTTWRPGKDSTASRRQKMPCKSFMNLEACTPSPSFFKCRKKFISCWQNAFIVPWFRFWSLRMCLSLLYDALKVRLDQLEREIKCRGRVHPSLLPVDMVARATLLLLALLHDGLCLPRWAKTSPCLLKLILLLISLKP